MNKPMKTLTFGDRTFEIVDEAARNNVETLTNTINNVNSNKIEITSIVDDLITTDSKKVLSANQGYILNNAINNLSNILNIVQSGTAKVINCTIPCDRIKGDFNADGHLTDEDVSLIVESISNIYEYDELTRWVADVNNDGIVDYESRFSWYTHYRS